MDTKSMNCKHPKKMKPSKDKHEVFVLPPDILKKLGISIGNINGSQEIPADGNGSPSTAIISNEPYEYIENIPAPNCNQKPNDTSILETASLMKKSVFLSPTFVSNTTNAIPGEIEISRKNIIEDSVDVCTLVEPQDSVFEPSDSIEVTKLISECNDNQEGCMINQYNNCMNGEQTLPNINQEHPCPSLDGNENPVVEINVTFDKNLTGNILPNGSEVNNGLGNDYSLKSENNVKLISSSTDSDSVCGSFNYETNNIPAPKSSKIDIISDETIPLSKLREIKRLKRRSLNGKKTKSVTVQSIAKITTKNGNSGLQSTEPNSIVPLDNTNILPSDLDEVNSEEDTVLSNLKSMYTNELIEATAVHSPTSLNDTEMIRTDIVSNTTEKVTLLENEENVKDHMYRTTSKYESPDKDTEAFKEDNTKNTINDCETKTSEDDVTLNAAIVNGLAGDKEVTINDGDKSVTIYNGQKNECIQPAGLGGTKKQLIAENEYQCNIDKMKQVCPIQETTVVEEHTTVEYTLKSKCNTKKSRNSKKSLDDSGVKKITEHKISSKNVENKTLEHDELNSILNATKKLSSNNTDIKVDKVKEIAAYLRKFSHIYTDKKKTKKALSNDITKKDKVNSNTNTIESKLCIQGVEKPGGTEVVREHTGECKVLKTYARRNSLKAPKLSAQILNKNETCNTLDALDLDLDTVNISKCERQQFCLCDDFGRLAYYDHEKLYEHIHFWHHHTANCELDLIFAIYSDEAIVSNSESGLEKEEKTEEKIEACNVCWNIFQSDFSENIDNPYTKLIGHKYVINEVNDANLDDSPQVPELNIAQKVDDGTVPKTHEVQMKNNSHSDIILETINHDVVDAAESKNSDSIRNIVKPLNTDINDNNSATVGSELINTSLGSSQPKLTATSASKTVSSEISNIFEKSSSDAKEKSHQHRQSSSNESTFSRKEVTLDSPKTSNISAPKRKLSGNTTPISESTLKKSVKCGLCNNIFSGVEWEHHVANEHHLIAWRAGGSINMDDPKLVQKLRERLKTAGVLECSLCFTQFKKFSRFMEHIKYCIRKKLSNEKKSEKPARKSRTANNESVTCGVCQRTMLSSNWLEHIGSLHDYLAWKQGQEALNLDNESEVWQHLQNIIRLNGSLTCYKCGLQRSRVQKYLAHIKTCNGTRERLDDSSMSLDLNSSSIQQPKCKVELVETSTVKCGVCEQEVCDSDWIEHICKTHNYLAWQETETPLDLDDEEAVRNHLQQLIRQNGGLTCHKCGFVRKRVKLYLTHIEMCDGTNSQINNSSNNVSLNTTTTSTDGWFEVPIEKDERKVVKCGVCSEEVPIMEWIHHVGKEHDYLAWQDGDRPLDLENELAVKVHLLEMSKLSGGLVCNKCEKRLKYPKTYLQHTKECTGPTASQEAKLEISTSSWIESFYNNEIKDQILTCGVCESNIESEKWFKHIETKHQYLAWVKGQPPLDLENAAIVQKHLNEISKVVGGLTCAKCGVKRKYVKWYLLHKDSCQATSGSTDLYRTLMNKDVVECAVCGETMEPKDWRNHAMKQHYNIAWVVGDNPIEINNPYAVENYLKEYQIAHNKLVCKVCKISRVSYVGFYAHIIVCGKTEKETEIYKSVCDICNNKYLRIYKSQHMTMHREKEYAKERKLLAAREQALKKEEEESAEVIIQTGRRKAAEKAKNVIENYKKDFHNGNFHCSKCGYNTEVEKELSDHVCIEDKWGDASDSDESVKIENFSGDETEESDIDSNVSDEEREAREQASSLKKKKHSDSSAAKICRLPYQINNTSSYLKRSTEEFIDTYLTDEDLFPLWHSCELEEVPENELTNYMPPIEESCKVRFDENQDWLTFNRLESNRVKDTIVMFLGACIQCMSWVPAAAEYERATRERHYLSVVTHRSDDAPRHAWDATLSERGIIQIWDCANLIATTPQFVLGIAHNFGTVWAIDWCPSGARDVFDLDPTPGNTHRLGLMAAACSNGLAYIFVVPYPSSITEKEKPFYKLNPVVELRLSSNENRRVYQATAIKWSVQKGHSQIVVGYADGTTAYYDLNGESPLLRTTENNRTVLYPYHDERVQNSCIEDIDMYPSGAGSHERAGGVVCVGSAGGAGAGALQSHVAAVKVLFPPHWPAALLAGDDCLVKQSINELEWWGGGRRLGGSCGAAGCAWCGRVCVSAPPLLRQLRVHPCFPDLHKQVIARILMIPFGAKRKRQNDELAMIVEPIAYSDAVKKYGVEFKQITAKNRTTQQKLSATPRVAYPERFPLSDVAAMKFCPTFKLHHKLAVGMHSGLIFIINV